MNEIFEEWNTYASKITLNPRNINLNNFKKVSNLKIVSIIGIRRSGKSSLLMLMQQKLNKENNKVAYINLEDSRIKNEKEILDNILKWFGDSGFLLLDEITSTKNWQEWLFRNHEMLKGRLNLIISSSRKSLMVPQKPLRGRMLQYEIYPLSFREFLDFNNIKIEHTTAGVGKIEKALYDYLVYGGFPEVVLSKNTTDKVKLINSYFKDVLGLDVAEISKENVSLVESFGGYVIESSHFSASKCLNFLKSIGYKIGKQSLLDLEKYSQAGYLFFFIPIFSNKVKDRLQYPRKTYMGDTGFMNAITGKKDMGRLFENAVFLELKRRLEINQEINYWKDSKGVEADFVVREGKKVKNIMQVVYSLDNEKTKQREIKGLVSCAKALGSKEGLIITKDYDGTKTIDKIKIKFIPLWEFLLKI